MACGQKLIEMGVKEVAMESHWCLLEALTQCVVPYGYKYNPGSGSAHMKNVPGRKTDMNETPIGLLKLHRWGLIRASLIPEDVFQRMRLLSRHRTNLVADTGRVKNRVQRILEDGNVKYGSIVSDVF